MTDNNQVFKSGDPTPRSDNPFADKLSLIKNEQGEPKYKSVEDALEALAHSQQFIETLKTEKQSIQEQLDAAKVEVDKRSSVEDIVARLTNNNSPKDVNKDDPPKQTLDENTVKEMVSSLLSNRENETKQQANAQTVYNTLIKEYGDKAQEVVNQKARELNTTPEQLGEMAKSNPTLVLTLLSGNKIQSGNPSKSTIHSQPNSPTPNEIPKPNRSVMRGGMNSKEVVDYWNQVKSHTHKTLGVES